MVSISVAMATFNGERFLAEQLASLKAQTLPPAELVVCDDGSSDKTEAVIEDFSRASPFPVRWIRNPARLGYRHNFMKAAGLARGDLIAFCDQDDIWAPDKLSKTTKPFEDSRVLLSYHGVELIDAEGRSLGGYDEEAPPVARLTERHFYPWLFGLGFTLTFRAQLHALTHLWPASLDFHNDDGRPLAHDQWFFFLAARLGDIVYIDEPLARYRQHGTNVYGAQTRRSRRMSYRERLKERHRRYLRSEVHCRQSAKILSEIANPMHADDAVKIAIARDRYKSLERYAALSCNMIGDPRIWQRLKAVYRLRALGYYDDTTEIAFERRPLSKDIFACMASTLMGSTDAALLASQPRASFRQSTP